MWLLTLHRTPSSGREAVQLVATIIDITDYGR